MGSAHCRPAQVRGLGCRGAAGSRGCHGHQRIFSAVIAPQALACCGCGVLLDIATTCIQVIIFSAVYVLPAPVCCRGWPVVRWTSLQPWAPTDLRRRDGFSWSPSLLLIQRSMCCTVAMDSARGEPERGL